MSVEITIPQLGESITEATISTLCKKRGDQVKMDEILLELETEKVTLEVNATASGIIDKMNVSEGDVVTIGQIVGSIKEGINASESDGKKIEKVTNPVNSSKESTEILKKDNLPPSVRRLVAEHNLDPKEIKGTGRDGRINKGDVINLISKSPSSEKRQDDEKPVKRVRMSTLRKTIAKRLKDSQNTAAILTTFNEIDMHAVINLRKKFKEKFKEKHGVKLGFMSFFVKAVVNALMEVPSVNAEIDDNHIIYKYYYDIGVAVGTEQGLVVPVIRNADKMSFSQIEQNIVDLATKAREGKLGMSDLTGGTFSITNGGVYGSLLSTPIINPPQTGIIGLHNTQEKPVVINGEIKIRPMMYVALSYDHRVIDGKDAVTFLVKVKEAIESPEKLLLGL